MRSIVLVDDSADIRRLVRSRLERSGVFVVLGEGSSGIDAISLAAQHRPDLVLLDVSMSGMDGLEAIPMVITAAPRTRVVMFSGFDEHGLAERAIDMGASAFIEKSTPLAELAGRLLAVLGDPAPPAPSAVESAAERDAESQLFNEHLERFRAAFDEAAIGMATLTLTGRIVRANTTMERLAGAQPGALVGTVFTDLAESTSRPGIAAAIMRVASGAMDADNASHRLDIAGRQAWVISTVAVVRDSESVPLYLFLQVQDVTERRRTETRLQLSEEMFRLLVEGVADYAIFMLDPTGHIASWNVGAQRIKGWTAAEVIGEHFELFYEDDARAAKHPEYELAVARAEGRYEEEGWRVRKDGSRFWANVVITAIHDDAGELVGFAKVTRDITDRLLHTQERDRAADHLAQSARDRTELLAVTAHELRGPVTLLQGYADLLHDHWRELDDAERDEMIATLVRSSTRLQRLVDDLLMASRLEAGAVEMRLAEIDLCPLIEAIARDVVPAGVPRIDVVCPPGARAVADAGRLQQILGNLLANALRYGEPPIAVTVTAVDGRIDIAVDDSGAGVDESLRESLFDKFAHGNHDESTGLGLFIVRELAIAQGGDARYEPRPGGGSRFVLTLPTPR